jgi:hypothetical protein
MDKINHRYFSGSVDKDFRTTGIDTAHEGSDVCIADKRIARLLVVLDDLDRSVAGLEELPQQELSDLIASAILACGFVNPTEAKYAIASVLQAIDGPGPPESS